MKYDAKNHWNCFRAFWLNIVFGVANLLWMWFGSKILFPSEVYFFLGVVLLLLALLCYWRLQEYQKARVLWKACERH